MSRLSVTVLMGGPDAERNISIESGNAVARALEESGECNVNLLLIDTPDASEIAAIEADVVFPVLHGPFGEGGPLQALLEQAALPFVGSGSASAANAMDKLVAKKIAIDAGIYSPAWCAIEQGKSCTITPPLVIKPISEGSSLDIVICMDDASVIKARTKLQQKRSHLFAEAYVHGRELTVGIINGKPLPIIEILPPSDLHTYNYEAKYERDDTKFILEPTLPDNTCVETAVELYECMGIRDIARVDFLLDSNRTWFIEINTMPGFTAHSLVPMAAKHVGIEMPELCTRLVHCAIDRNPIVRA